MTKHDEFELFLTGMLELTGEEVRARPDVRDHAEAVEQCAQKCKELFSPPQRAAAMEYLDRLSYIHAMQEEYYYRQGMRDGITLLKWLGILPQAQSG